MIVRWLAVAVLFAWASAAQAADWWWVGHNGTAPNRVVSYVDRDSIRQSGGGVTEVWALAVGETALPSGQQHQANHFGFKCRQRTFSQLGRIPLNAAWQRVPLMDVPPAPYAPVARGSIGESIMNLVCGHPTGSELHVDQPAQHALAYLRSLDGAAHPPAPAGGLPQPGAGNSADAGQPGRPRPSGQPGGAPTQASEWWWIGTEDSGLYYVDRAAIRTTQDGRREVYLLEIFGTPHANGATRAVAALLIDCRNRTYERTGGLAMDEQGHDFPDSGNDPPTGAIPPGTIGDHVYGMACGQPSVKDTRIDNPLAHAGAYFHRQYADLGNGPPAAAGSATDGGGQPSETQPPGLSVGTAFFVGPEGYALTAYHVIDGADRIACRTGDGQTHEAVVTRMNQANDIALLHMNVRPTRYLGLAPRGSLRAGERVFTIGYGAPSYLGINEPRFTEGVVSALSGLEANDAEVQITVPIQPGNSGGPLVNEAGQLVGIITSTAAADTFQQEVGATPQSINWAVKADYAAPLLPHLPPARPMARAQAIALTHDAVCLVMALRGRPPGE